MKLSDKQASQVLGILVDEGRLKEREIRAALVRHRRKIKELRAQLRRLEGGDGPFPEARVVTRPRRRAAAKRNQRTKRVSAERRSAMRQQGVYLAAVRPLKPADRAKVKATRASKGFKAAISEARKLAKAS